MQVVQICPEEIASALYSEELLSRSILDYVANAKGITEGSKALKITMNCQTLISCGSDQKEKLKTMLKILRDNGPGDVAVAQRIEQVCLMLCNNYTSDQIMLATIIVEPHLSFFTSLSLSLQP